MAGKALRRPRRYFDNKRIHVRIYSRHGDFTIKESYNCLSVMVMQRCDDLDLGKREPVTEEEKLFVARYAAVNVNR